jgi:glycosyltransferase involved in cell wall biosynthesis
MLSILIPTYNYDITQLVKDLHVQAEELGIQYEIIVMEDGSDQFLVSNQQIGLLNHCRYIALPNNIGRSAIRNRLADEARFPYLLFMDCDASVCNKDYLLRYLPFCEGKVIVIGGTAYDPDCQNPAFSLRLKYGRERESNLAYLLQHHEKENFATFNFLISKSIFSTIRFDESIAGYGHEDTLFGHALHEAGFIFQHIDNPLIHKGLDDNRTYLKKTAESVRNLYLLFNSGKYPFLADESKLLRMFLRLKKYNLTKLAALKFVFVRKLMERNLTGKHPDLYVYDVYKLLLLCKFQVNADKMTV